MFLKNFKINKSLKEDIKKYPKPVVTRFPPEPSGYLHIGHAKALLINYVVSQFGNGKMLVRMDDTNPCKESIEFEEAIIYDVKEILDYLNYEAPPITYTSDYFDKLLDCANDLVLSGKAYVDKSIKTIIKHERKNTLPSSYRDNSIETNLQYWEEMKEGKLIDAILRIKIDYKSGNGCLRDPTIYRCLNEAHARTGNKFKVYPTYDFACPIVDCLEGVTHVWRSTEFTDRNPQYKYILEMVELVGFECPILNQYGKLTFKDVVLSKRKIKAMIEDNQVSGWDDHRLLTYRGAKKRGLCLEGLIQFLSTIGVTKNDVDMNQHALWKINQKYIDKVSSRLIAINSTNLCEIRILDDLSVVTKKVLKFQRNPDLGERTVYYSNYLIMDIKDIQDLKVNEEITLINWGNAIYLGNLKFQLHLAGDFKTTEKKLVWLPIDHYQHVKLLIGDVEEKYLTEDFDIEDGGYVQFYKIHYFKKNRDLFYRLP